MDVIVSGVGCSLDLYVGSRLSRPALLHDSVKVGHWAG